MDYNHNYQEKIKLIERAEGLKNYPDIIKASRDLNILHKQWKNDLGPVAKEHREDLWKRFQNASKEIQERRQVYQKDAIGEMKKNMAKKEELLIEISMILNNTNAYKKIEELLNQTEMNIDIEDLGTTMEGSILEFLNQQ